MMLFTGILSDVAWKYLDRWLEKSWALLGIYIVLFITNLIIRSKANKINELYKKELSETT